MKLSAGISVNIFPSCLRLAINECDVFFGMASRAHGADIICKQNVRGLLTENLSTNYARAVRSGSLIITTTL